MNSAILTFALALQAVNADFGSDAGVASSAANALSSSVAAWSKEAGLAGALVIQDYFPTLSSAVGALSEKAGSVSDSDVNAQTVLSFGTAVVGLLDALSAKAADFSLVGASAIVADDIKGITGSTGAIVSDIVKAVQSDCDKVNSLTSVFGALESKFSAAASAYSVPPPKFPAAPTCKASSPSVTSASSMPTMSGMSGIPDMPGMPGMSAISTVTSLYTASVPSSEVSSTHPSASASKSGSGYDTGAGVVPVQGPPSLETQMPGFGLPSNVTAPPLANGASRAGLGVVCLIWLFGI